MAMRAAVLVAVSLLLAGCGPSKEKILARCEMDGVHALGHARPAGYERQVAHYAYLCMKAHGYRFAAQRTHCDNPAVWTNQAVAECYETAR